MSIRTRSLLTASAVYVGAVILIAMPVTAVVSTAFGTGLDTIGLESSWSGLVALGLSLVIGLQLAFEAATLQLGGLNALDQGPAWLAGLRQLTLTASVALALLAIGWMAVSAATGGYGTATVVLGVAVAAAACLVFLRGAGEFVAGFRSA